MKHTNNIRKVERGCGRYRMCNAAEAAGLGARLHNRTEWIITTYRSVDTGPIVWGNEEYNKGIQGAPGTNWLASWVRHTVHRNEHKSKWSNGRLASNVLVYFHKGLWKVVHRMENDGRRPGDSVRGDSKCYMSMEDSEDEEYSCLHTASSYQVQVITYLRFTYALLPLNLPRRRLNILWPWERSSNSGPKL